MNFTQLQLHNHSIENYCSILIGSVSPGFAATVFLREKRDFFLEAFMIVEIMIHQPEMILIVSTCMGAHPEDHLANS